MKTNKILTLTSSFDQTVSYLIKKYPNINFIRFNMDELQNYQISITNEKVYFKSNEFETKNLFSEINSIYFRKIFLPNLNEYDKSYHNYMQKEIYNFIVGLADSFKGKVLTKPSILRRVENKIFQLSLAEKLNFLIPKSIISNDSDFVNENSSLNEWIAKPISIGKIRENKSVMTNILNQKVSEVELSPTYFQEKIKKDYELRVTVINNYFFCVKINSKLIDWREDKNIQYEVIETPKIIKEQCLKFMNECVLKFGAFDYIVSDGKYYFLECNPNGQWAWLEMELGLDISKKIVEYLIYT